MAKKKFIYDSILNIIATTFPLIILQFVTLPIVASTLGDQRYGSVITLISLFTIVSLPFGNVLNNIRLLTDDEYDRDGFSGDFNILLLISILISSILMIIAINYYYEAFSIINMILMITISSLSLLKEYLIVTFRLILNFKGILINNIFLAIGYLIGTFIFYLTNYWESIYIVGLGSSLIYIIKNTKLHKEPLKVTPFFKRTTYKSFILFCSGFLKTALSHADKLLLFPLVGARAVSVYYTASIFGRVFSVIITPINSVMLSYLSKMNKFKTSRFLHIIGVLFIIGSFGYFVIVIASHPLITFLYPKWAGDSLELIYITTATAIISVISSVLNPFILKFYNINWQILIASVNLILYISFAILFYNLYGLFGFCLGILFANIAKLILMLSIFIFNNKKSKQ